MRLAKELIKEVRRSYLNSGTRVGPVELLFATSVQTAGGRPGWETTYTLPDVGTFYVVAGFIAFNPASFAAEEERPALYQPYVSAPGLYPGSEELPAPPSAFDFNAVRLDSSYTQATRPFFFAGYRFLVNPPVAQ